jgi:hypothetical protein
LILAISIQENSFKAIIMKKIIWFTLAVVIIALIVGTFIYLYAFRKADLSAASRKADIEIKASELLKKFTDNETSANAEFLDKVIIVNGLIDKISEDSTDISVYLKNPQDMAGIMCGFNKTTIDKSILKPGNNMRIKGICTGYLMDVVLNKCSVEK